METEVKMGMALANLNSHYTKILVEDLGKAEAEKSFKKMIELNEALFKLLHQPVIVSMLNFECYTELTEDETDYRIHIKQFKSDNPENHLTFIIHREYVQIRLLLNGIFMVNEYDNSGDYIDKLDDEGKVIKQTKKPKTMFEMMGLFVKDLILK